MEKQLVENPREVWKLVWLFAMFPFALLVINVFITGDIIFSAEVGFIIICACGIYQWLSYRSPGKRPAWFLLDGGLKCVDVSGNEKIIAWDQIYWMKWLRYYGLMVQWKAPDSTKGRASQELLRARIGLNKEDAKEILSAWEKMNHTPRA